MGTGFRRDNGDRSARIREPMQRDRSDRSQSFLSVQAGQYAPSNDWTDHRRRSVITYSTASATVVAARKVGTS